MKTAQVALESTLFLHGVPHDSALPLARELLQILQEEGAEGRIISVHNGVPSHSADSSQLQQIISDSGGKVPKLNTANLGVALFQMRSGATTVSATMELAAQAGIQWFATGGLGGVHPFRNSGDKITLDISSDLFAFTRFPIAVVASGVKSILDVEATREMLETLGVPVIGYQTDEFPAFYFRRDPSGAVIPVDARVDDIAALSQLVRAELNRTGRGVLIVNPIRKEAELSVQEWNDWLHAAQVDPAVVNAVGRDKTPRLLAALHLISKGKTLSANMQLIRDNVRLAGQLAFQSAK